MQYQRAQNLGMIANQAGIPANARIFFQINTNGPLGLYIWNLETEQVIVMVTGRTDNPIRIGRQAVPEHVKQIMSASDDELKERWLATEGWDEVRETVYSELTFRGISILEMERTTRH